MDTLPSVGSTPHGVDLNRNFPASNYKNSRRYGKESASEPETQAILRALDQLQPALIISIHSIDGGRECDNYDGPGEAMATVMSGYNKYPVEPTIGYPTPGSMGTYCGIDRKIPMITLERAAVGIGGGILEPQSRRTAGGDPGGALARPDC